MTKCFHTLNAFLSREGTESAEGSGSAIDLLFGL